MWGEGEGRGQNLLSWCLETFHLFFVFLTKQTAQDLRHSHGVKSVQGEGEGEGEGGKELDTDLYTLRTQHHKSAALKSRTEDAFELAQDLLHSSRLLWWTMVACFHEAS